jgi:hypothetical protein
LLIENDAYTFLPDFRGHLPIDLAAKGKKSSNRET